MSVVTREFSLRRHTIPLKINEKELFVPNAVSGLFAKTVEINPGDIVFDIGSGVGPLTIWSAQEPSQHVYSVEIVKSQYQLLLENIKDNGVSHKVTAYQGEFFDPIPQGIKADVIIGDVSGIARIPAVAFGWYPPEIPTGGEDGTEVIIPLLERAGRYLKEGGRLYFPIAVSLSDSGRIMDVARARFENLEVLTQPTFPLTPEQVNRLGDVSDRPYIRLESKGSRTVWRGEIYKATNPILT